MFCASHSIPHEDCGHCQVTVKSMRPTIFAELAAAELRSGTECCPVCDFIYHQAIASCPQCGTPHPLHVEVRPTRPAPVHEPVAELDWLTFRDVGEPGVRL
jgi:hypothetical protein